MSRYALWRNSVLQPSTEASIASSVPWSASTRETQIAQATRIAFWIASAAFLIWYAWLGSVSNQPGSWDSTANLIVARNLAEGRGFVTDFVGDYVVRHELPGPEFTRPPGLPYLIAPIYRVFGVSLSAHVWLNALVVLLSAWVVRAAIRADGGTGRRTSPAWQCFRCMLR